MHMCQFNGKHECSWCELPGKITSKGNGHCRAYLPPPSTPKLRTHESLCYHARKARPENKKSSCGVSGTSVLLMLAYFNFCSGFVVDYMHSVCSGFVKATTILWLKSKRCKEFYFHKHPTEMNKRIVSMTPVSEMSRLPRSFKNVAHWKSAEWRDWMLFYSPILLADTIPVRHYHKWMTFVNIMHYLLGPSVSF
ncbi:hypothetical protein HPB48_009085 [Haemaphysalis longicornis]|uniref:Uncharacterized protein n=1 Tax=Haemaphysalis longicornis TaxID=44386 RepID=A0A9J6FXJ8_HAELO|nr:hypothetical protein HPB48_009085 [Haemaphysalis longicornis]